MDVRDELIEIRRLLEALLRWGTVDSVDAGAGTVVVNYPDSPQSLPMPWALTSAAFYAEPTAGDQALVVAPSGDPLNQVALVGVASTDADAGNKSEAARSDLVKTELDDIRDKHDNHVHDHNLGPGTTLVPKVLIGPAQDVKANKVKVD